MGIETMAIVGLAMSAAAAGISAYSSYEQGKSRDRLAKYNAAVEQNRAIQAQLDARSAASAKRREAEKLEKRQRALYAKAGVTTEGTPLEVMIDTATDMELEALEIERSGTTLAEQHLTQAEIDKFTGAAAKRAGTMGAGATLLQGAGQMASSYSSFKHTGAIG